MNEYILSAQNISYEADNEALLHDITINIPRGSFVGIIGPNGSGKSTLLKTIYRANKASAGSVYLNGTKMGRMSGKEIARQMAVVAQENQVSFDFSVMEQKSGFRLVLPYCFGSVGSYGIKLIVSKRSNTISSNCK